VGNWSSLNSDVNYIAGAQDLSQYSYDAIRGFDPTGLLIANPCDPNAEAGMWLGIVGGLLDGAGEAKLASKTEEVTSFLGSKRNQLQNLQKVRNEPAVINGRQYTGHALDQMQNRGLVPSVVEDTLARGTQTAGRDGATIYTTEQARVIVNPNGSIKTVNQQ
jgi:hypothetical protein